MCLFYVAVIRAAQRLLVTAAALDDNEHDTEPCNNFLLMKRNASTDSIVAWHDPAEAAATDTIDEQREVQQSSPGMFPKPTKTVNLLTGTDWFEPARRRERAGFQSNAYQPGRPGHAQQNHRDRAARRHLDPPLHHGGPQRSPG